ncbi:MAG TPA: acetolactate synthase small subunit [Gammaproteobacteria bacterium]|nr:acetolactate synthase small subunit [Gammaproteobacteria bacterium]|tara:strand:+ start:7778 stop:8278 length:501 start_codon:yes stop_codon:yes gene_type:complete
MSVRHTISILLENEAGALSRVSGLFSARAYNIESLSVAPTEEPTVSRLTLVTRGSPEIIEQITKQLNKLVDVIRLVDLNEDRAIERELMLIKLHAAGGEQREEVKRLIDIFDGRVVDVTDSTYTVEIIGDGEQLDSFIEAANPKRIVEVVRSGILGILRGSRALRA